MTRTDVSKVIEHLEASVEAKVKGSWWETMAWNRAKAFLTPARIKDVEDRLVAAGVIQDDPAPVAADPAPAAPPATPAQ